MKESSESVAQLRGRWFRESTEFGGQVPGNSRVVREQGVVELSLEQSRRVAKAMISPPEPNAALRKAFAEHRAKVDS